MAQVILTPNLTCLYLLETSLKALPEMSNSPNWNSPPQPVWRKGLYIHSSICRTAWKESVSKMLSCTWVQPSEEALKWKLYAMSVM